MVDMFLLKASRSESVYIPNLEGHLLASHLYAHEWIEPTVTLEPKAVEVLCHTTHLCGPFCVGRSAGMYWSKKGNGLIVERGEQEWARPMSAGTIYVVSCAIRRFPGSCSET